MPVTIVSLYSLTTSSYNYYTCTSLLLHHPGDYPPNILTYLKELGHSVQNMTGFSVVQGVMRSDNGTVSAHADSRKQSYALRLKKD